MTAITIANKDWDIIDEISTALAGATVDGATVFKQVTVAVGAEEAKETQFRGDHPIAIVRYVDSVEDESPEGLRGCAVTVELILAAKVGPRGADQADRIREALRLASAAKNAIEASPPADAHYWGDGNRWRDKLKWGSPHIDTGEAAPWVVVALPLTVSYTLADGTSH